MGDSKENNKFDLGVKGLTIDSYSTQFQDNNLKPDIFLSGPSIKSISTSYFICPELLNNW